ncbi:MAG: ABC transporter substrate-binding protein [Alphaproteobacteria bacterium]|nr:ABC transporter substrate-binding protein [Alphaproteobacteria bacterium]
MRVLVAATLISIGVAASAAADLSFRLGVTAMPPQRANPFKTTGVTSAFVLPAIHDSLAAIDNDGKLQPRLAVGWRAIDPLTWEFTLRDGVRFSNDEELTAQAAVATFETLATIKNSGSVIARELNNIVSVTASDRLTFVIKLKQPNAVLPQHLYNLNLAPPALMAQVGIDGLNDNAVGTGPFVVENWQPNLVTMRANRSSWRPPKVDRLEVHAVPDSIARVQALITGQIDAGIAVDLDQEATMTAAGLRLAQRAPQRILTIAFYTLDPKSPFADPRVRLAVNLGVNMKLITDTFLQGRVGPASQGALPSALGYDPELKPYGYDPDRARALLTEAGYPEGIVFSYSFVPGTLPGDSGIMQQIAADLLKIGVTMKILPITYAQLVRYTLQGGWETEAVLQDFPGNSYDGLRPYQRGGHTCNGTSPWHCDRRIQPTIDAAETEPALEKRIDLTREVIRHYHREATTLLLYPVLGLDGIGPRVKSWVTWGDQIRYDLLEVND